MEDNKVRRKKRESDFAIIAFRVVQGATEGKEPEPTKTLLYEGKNPNVVALGRLGGLKGCKA